MKSQLWKPHAGVRASSRTPSDRIELLSRARVNVIGYSVHAFFNKDRDGLAACPIDPLAIEL